MTIPVGNTIQHTVDGVTDFFMDVHAVTDYSFTAILNEVTSWNDKDEVQEFERYADVYIKWDGCSEIKFQPLHLCGVYNWKKHVAIIEWVYKISSIRIAQFSSDQLWI